jgi:hypothetical protein
VDAAGTWGRLVVRGGRADLRWGAAERDEMRCCCSTCFCCGPGPVGSGQSARRFWPRLVSGRQQRRLLFLTAGPTAAAVAAAAVVATCC